MHSRIDLKKSRSTTATTTQAELAAPKRSALRAIAIVLARHEIRKLKRFYAEFEHDILLPLLLGEITLHNMGIFENTRGASDEAPLDDDDLAAAGTLKPCNAYSIAAATDLPRETVRRKIGRLVELGWIDKRPNGHLFVTETALEHFGGLLTAHALPELLDTAERVRKLIDEDENPPRGS